MYRGPDNEPCFVFSMDVKTNTFFLNGGVAFKAFTFCSLPFLLNLFALLSGSHVSFSFCTPQANLPSLFLFFVGNDGCLGSCI